MEEIEERNKSFYDSLKLVKYGFGLKATGFVSFLAWTGMTMGVLGLLSSVELLVLPTEIINFTGTLNSFYTQYNHAVSTPSYIGGIIGLLVSTFWFSLHLALRKRNVEKDHEAVKGLLKIKSYITSGIEITVSLLGMCNSIMALVEDPQARSGQFLFQGGVCAVYLILTSCQVHGVRSDRNSFIKPYIIFKLSFVVLGAVSMAFLLAEHLSGTTCVLFLLGLLVSTFFFIFYIGDVIVIFNFNQHLLSKIDKENLDFVNQAFMDENITMNQGFMDGNIKMKT